MKKYLLLILVPVVFLLAGCSGNIGGGAYSFNSVGTSASSTVGTSATVVLSKNSGRMYAAFTNDGADDIYLNLGATSTAAVGKGIRINANGGSYEINDLNLYTGQVSAISETDGVNLCVTEK